MTDGNEGAPKTSTKRKGYSLAYFAQKHRISIPMARALIEHFGDDRDALNHAADLIRRT